MSAREPASWPVIPTDFTEGEWSGLAGPTSKLKELSRCPVPVFSSARNGRRSMILLMKIELASARSFEADTMRNLSCGLFHNFQTTKAHVMKDLPMPRKACRMNLRCFPSLRVRAMSIWHLVGLGMFSALSNLCQCGLFCTIFSLFFFLVASLLEINDHSFTPL